MRRADLTPATIAWLASVGALAIRWGSPLSGFYTNAIPADAFVAVAAFLFVFDLARGRTRLVWRSWHFWLVAFIVWQALAAVAAADRGAALKDLMLVFGLAVLAVITAALAEERAAARALARVVLASVLLTFALAVVGMALFYAGHDSGLLGRYGDLAESSSYTRVRAGFPSAPLLASWCIAASAVIAWPRGELPRGWRIAGQLALAFVVVATLSRGALAFGVALLIRWAAPSRALGPKLLAASAGVAVVVLLALLTWGNLETRPLAYTLPYPGPRHEGVVTAWHTLREHPAFGIGPGTEPGFYFGVRFRAHLTPLNVAATSGLPALLLLTGMVAALWRGRSRPTDVAIWSGLAGLMIDGLAQDIEHFRHVWLLIGLAAATNAASASQHKPPHALSGVGPDPARDLRYESFD